jgi:hypothetical protein
MTTTAGKFGFIGTLHMLQRFSQAGRRGQSCIFQANRRSKQDRSQSNQEHHDGHQWLDIDTAMMR